MSLFQNPDVDPVSVGNWKARSLKDLESMLETYQEIVADASFKLASARKIVANIEAAIGEKKGKPDGKIEVMLYTDGSCRAGIMGIGVRAVASTGHSRERSETCGVGNAQIAELLAIQRGLELIGELDRSRVSVAVHTDSAYAIGVVTGAFKTKKNRELVEDIRGLVSGFASVRFEKVRAHSGHFGNVKADKLARAASRQ